MVRKHYDETPVRDLTHDYLLFATKCLLGDVYRICLKNSVH